MLMKGVAHCHQNSIMHRVYYHLSHCINVQLGMNFLKDLKPANLLLSSSGHLKLADFGLARVFSNEKGRLYSHQVATRQHQTLITLAVDFPIWLVFYYYRWYRAPELLYGAREYDAGVDLWAVGCIFGELLNNSPLFPGENDIEQLCCVLRVLGTPTEEMWPVDLIHNSTLIFLYYTLCTMHCRAWQNFQTSTKLPFLICLLFHLNVLYQMHHQMYVDLDFCLSFLTCCLAGTRSSKTISSLCFIKENLSSRGKMHNLCPQIHALSI
jgi:serine/threonine protein kinase